MKYTTQQSGFSFVETLVAVTILLVIIVGPMTISSSASRSTSYSSEAVIAFFLAQEGLEIVQRIRDDMILRHFHNSVAYPNQWDAFTDDTGGALLEYCYTTNGCGVYVNTDVDATPVVSNCAAINNCRLRLDLADDKRARYTHQTPASYITTPYSRVIKITHDNARPNEVKVESWVYWRTDSLRNVQEVKLETYLYNVYGN